MLFFALRACIIQCSRPPAPPPARRHGPPAPPPGTTPAPQLPCPPPPNTFSSSRSRTCSRIPDSCMASSAKSAHAPVVTPAPRRQGLACGCAVPGPLQCGQQERHVRRAGADWTGSTQCRKPGRIQRPICASSSGLSGAVHLRRQQQQCSYPAPCYRRQGGRAASFHPATPATHLTCGWVPGLLPRS